VGRVLKVVITGISEYSGQKKARKGQIELTFKIGIKKWGHRTSPPINLFIYSNILKLANLEKVAEN
jgi:hypothetical protein